MERILANSLFKNSRRYPTLLRYVVERTLEGHPGELKERTLGVEVFGREPDYDTNLDPVVRTTAAEVRKRLAQYYQDPRHETEVRIDLPPGSYAAKFQVASEKHPPVASTIAIVEPALVPAVSPPSEKTVALPSHLRRFASTGAVAAAILVCAWIAVRSTKSDLDRLWAPVLEAPSPVLLCVGQREFVGVSAVEPKAVMERGAATPLSEINLFQLYYLGSQNAAMPDVLTMGMLAGLLQAKGKPFHVRGESSTTFEDVRDGPVILIGAFNNDWSMRLAGTRRFTFERDGDTFWIKDRDHPSDKSHAVNYADPYLKVTEDYAVISRVLDPVTERMAVLAGGLTGYGTIAAGEFLTHPGYVKAVAAGAPAKWAHKNMQILIATKVINGKSGPPRVLTAHFW